MNELEQRQEEIKRKLIKFIETIPASNILTIVKLNSNGMFDNENYDLKILVRKIE